LGKFEKQCARHQLNFNEQEGLNKMFLEINAELLYTRPCLAKHGSKKLAASQHLLLSPPFPLKMHVDGVVISALIGRAQTIEDLFNVNKLGQALSASYALNYHDDDDGNNWFSYLQSEFSGLSWDDYHRHETVWDEDMVEQSYQEHVEEEEDYMFDGDKPTYEEYKDEFTENRYEIIDEWLVSNRLDIEDHNLIYVSGFGGQASGVWYPADYNFSGMMEIISIKIISEKSKDSIPITLDELKAMAFSEASENFDSEHETLQAIKEIEEQVESNHVATSIMHAQNVLDSERKSKRNFYIGLFIIIAFIWWL
jgi:hypothetical protein